MPILTEGRKVPGNAVVLRLHNLQKPGSSLVLTPYVTFGFFDDSGSYQTQRHPPDEKFLNAIKNLLTLKRDALQFTHKVLPNVFVRFISGVGNRALYVEFSASFSKWQLSSDCIDALDSLGAAEAFNPEVSFNPDDL